VKDICADIGGILRVALLDSSDREAI